MLRLTEVCNCFSGSPRVVGDEEDDGIDDLDFEFDYRSGIGSEQVSDTFSRRNSEFDLASAPPGSQVPMLTYGEEVGSYISQLLTFSFCLFCIAYEVPLFLAHFWFGCFCRMMIFLLIDMLLLFLHHLVMFIGFIKRLLLIMPVSF